jgi:hypothetical protein
VVDRLIVVFSAAAVMVGAYLIALLANLLQLYPQV